VKEPLKRLFCMKGMKDGERRGVLFLSTDDADFAD